MAPVDPEIIPFFGENGLIHGPQFHRGKFLSPATNVHEGCGDLLFAFIDGQFA